MRAHLLLCFVVLPCWPKKKLRTLFSLSWSRAVLGFPHVIFNVSRMLFYFSRHHYRRNWAPTQKKAYSAGFSLFAFLYWRQSTICLYFGHILNSICWELGNRIAKTREHFLPQLIWLECVTMVKKCIKPFSSAPQRVHPKTKLSMNKQIVNMCSIFTIDGSKADSTVRFDEGRKWITFPVSENVGFYQWKVHALTHFL